MEASKIFTSCLKEVGLTQEQLAKKVNWNLMQLNGRLQRGTLRADDFINLLDVAGIDIKYTVRETGREVRVFRAGAGRRIRQMVDKVKYDTAASNALANDFYADGVHEFSNGRATELYSDREGRFFFAEYTNWEGSKDRITPVSAEAAAEFIRQNGTEIDKKPKEEEA